MRCIRSVPVGSKREGRFMVLRAPLKQFGMVRIQNWGKGFKIGGFKIGGGGLLFIKKCESQLQIKVCYV